MRSNIDNGLSEKLSSIQPSENVRRAMQLIAKYRDLFVKEERFNSNINNLIKFSEDLSLTDDAKYYVLRLPMKTCFSTINNFYSLDEYFKTDLVYKWDVLGSKIKPKSKSAFWRIYHKLPSELRAAFWGAVFTIIVTKIANFPERSLSELLEEASILMSQLIQSAPQQAESQTAISQHYQQPEQCSPDAHQFPRADVLIGILSDPDLTISKREQQK